MFSRLTNLFLSVDVREIQYSNTPAWEEGRPTRQVLNQVSELVYKLPGVILTNIRSSIVGVAAPGAEPSQLEIPA